MGKCQKLYKNFLNFPLIIKKKKKKHEIIYAFKQIFKNSYLSNKMRIIIVFFYFLEMTVYNYKRVLFTILTLREFYLQY